MYFCFCGGGKIYTDISGHRLGASRGTAGYGDSLVSWSFTAVLLTSGVLPAILQHSDKEPNEAAGTVTIVKQWL